MASVSASERKALDKIYLNTSSAASFTSPGKLYATIKKTHPEITRRIVEDYLLEKSSYYLHKPAPKRLKKVNKTMAATLHDILGIDLVDLGELSAQNHGFRYILVGVDLFSRYAYGVPMKTKSCSISTINAVKEMFPKKIPYNAFYSDMGGEFVCSDLKKFLDTKNVRIYFATNIVKVSITERFIRTFRLKLERYMEENSTRTYIDVLQQLIQSYNDTDHSGIGRSPASVTDANSREVYQYQYLPIKSVREAHREKRLQQNIRFKFSIDDVVRVSMPKRSVFSKETRRDRWSEELFRIHSRQMRYAIPVYKLIDLMGEVIRGTWYEAELSRAFESEHYKLDPDFKVKTRTVNKKKQHFVSFLGYPKKFNMWVDETDFKNLQK